MPTQALYRADAYLRHCDAHVTHVEADGVELDQTVFYPLGGGHAGDRGTLSLADGTTLRVVDSRKSRREGATPDDTLHMLDPADRERLVVGASVR
ncbi:MAG TPA: alanyl-tRNA editing protein, partial [Burkholderiaceae bacterium]|nr:alanyl-tRNA editing protein [Burkholderiaceae bacterium]